jgi:hypothetical protein
MPFMTRQVPLVLGVILLFAAPLFAQNGPTPESTDALRKAASLFQTARDELQSNPRTEPKSFALAATFFQLALSKGAELTPDQQAAFMYCRIRVSADKLNKAGADVRQATEVLAEAEELVRLSASNATLKKLSQDLVQAAKTRGATSPVKSTYTESAIKVVGRVDGWEVLETDSFRIRHTNQRTLAEQLGKAAEKARHTIFTKWSNAPSGPWNVKCELLLHPDASSLAQATKQPNEATGHAWLKLEDGQVTERRIDLRADDLSAVEDALPRELTYIILGDLFWDKAPPKWAELGMAVLSSSVNETSRYRRSLGRCAQSGELGNLQDLLQAKEIPTDRVTGFYVGSVNLVDFLVRWKGEKTFINFLRDAQRYGQASGLQRHYGVRDPQQLQQLWLQGELSR